MSAFQEFLTQSTANNVPIGLYKRSVSVLLIENDKTESISLLNLLNSRVLYPKRAQKASQNA